MKVSIILFLALLLAMALAEQSSNHTNQTKMKSTVLLSKEISLSNEFANKKEKFDLCLGMLKEYYNALDSRTEKSFALLIVVIGWLITSDTARKSLSEDSTCFWAAIVTLTAAILFLVYNTSHFLDRFREIQDTIEKLNYVDHKYFTRYRMPDNILLSYLAPVLILYFFIVLLLIQIRYNLLRLIRQKKFNKTNAADAKCGAADLQRSESYNKSQAYQNYR